MSDVKVLPLPSLLFSINYAAQNGVKACCDLYGDIQVQGVSAPPPLGTPINCLLSLPILSAR